MPYNPEVPPCKGCGIMGHITTRCPTCPVRGTCLRKSHERNSRGRKVSLSRRHHHPYYNTLGLGAERRGGWDAGGYGGRYPAFRVQDRRQEATGERTRISPSQVMPITPLVRRSVRYQYELGDMCGKTQISPNMQQPVMLKCMVH